MTVGPIAQPSPTPPDPREAQVREAARQFESLLLTQLVSVMRSSLGDEGVFGSGPGSEMYTQMFDQNFAEAMSSGSGMGLRTVFERAMMGPRAYAEQPMSVPFVPRELSAPLPVRPASGAAIGGLTGRLQAVAREMLPGGSAPQWGRDGRLSANDLASDFSTHGPDGEARFNVRDAAGFEGAYKCNLFAFEMVRRAGFSVPLIGRTRGWGYLGPDAVTNDAAQGRLRGDWGRVATGESAESLDSAVVRGERAFILSGTSVGDRAGHMGVIERVRSVDYDDDGSIRRIVFDGWEGRSTGARHLTARTWNRYGNPGGDDTRGGFERIEIIELSRVPEGERPERPLHPHARPSVHDVSASSRAELRPIGR